MALHRDMMSQTIRIDIPPDVLKKTEDGKPRKVIPVARPPVAKTATANLGVATLDSNFQALFQRVYDGALIADLKGRITDANVRAVEFLQYDRNELQNMRVTDVISGSDESLIQALRENLEKDLFTLIQAYCARKDGTLFPAEIAVNRLRLSDQDNLCFFVRDITLRRQAEELLRTEHNAIQNSGNGIAIATLDARFEYVNPAVLRLWGFSGVEEVLGSDIREFLKDPALADTIIGAVRGGKAWNGHSVAMRKDGSEFHVQISVAGNRDADDELVSMVFSFVDVSDSRRAEEAERQAERQRVMMESLGTACHHLGQPATVLLASLEVMQKIAADEKHPAMKELLDSGMEAAESMRDMLHELNAMTEYKTRPYLEKQSGKPAGDTMILDFQPES